VEELARSKLEESKTRTLHNWGKEESGSEMDSSI
jgi:hypothetical protein